MKLSLISSLLALTGAIHAALQTEPPTINGVKIISPPHPLQKPQSFSGAHVAAAQDEHKEPAFSGVDVYDEHGEIESAFYTVQIPAVEHARSNDTLYGGGFELDFSSCDFFYSANIVWAAQGIKEYRVATLVYALNRTADGKLALGFDSYNPETDPYHGDFEIYPGDVLTVWFSKKRTGGTYEASLIFINYSTDKRLDRTYTHIIPLGVSSEDCRGSKPRVRAGFNFLNFQWNGPKVITPFRPFTLNNVGFNGGAKHITDFPSSLVNMEVNGKTLVTTTEVTDRKLRIART